MAVEFQWKGAGCNHQTATVELAIGPPICLEVIEVHRDEWRASVYLGDQVIDDFDCEGFDDGKPRCEDTVRKWAKAVAEGLSDD